MVTSRSRKSSGHTTGTVGGRGHCRCPQPEPCTHCTKPFPRLVLAGTKKVFVHSYVLVTMAPERKRVRKLFGRLSSDPKFSYKGCTALVEVTCISTTSLRFASLPTEDDSRAASHATILIAVFCLVIDCRRHKLLTMPQLSATSRRVVRTLAHRAQIDWYVKRKTPDWKRPQIDRRVGSFVQTRSVTARFFAVSLMSLFAYPVCSLPTGPVRYGAAARKRPPNSTNSSLGWPCRILYLKSTKSHRLRLTLALPKRRSATRSWSACWKSFTRTTSLLRRITPCL